MLVARNIRILAVCAILFAAIGMSGGHAAMARTSAPGHQMTGSAHHGGGDVAMPAGHCDPGQGGESRDGKSASIDCMIACAVILGEAQVARDMLPAARASPGLPSSTMGAGLHPEREPPPPRLS